MGDKLRIGLVGTGFGTRVHMPAFAAVADDVEVVGICSAQRARAEEAAQRFGLAFATDDYRELVAHPDIDLVDVCTPPDSHHDIALAAIEAGKHVLCEKPMALDTAQAAAMAQRAAAAGVLHAVNHEMRLTPAWRYLHQLVREGYLGRLRFVSVAVHAAIATDPSQEPYYWGWLSQASKGGGFLMGMLSHQIDLVRYAFGEITDVAGRADVLVTERPVLTFDYRDGDPIGPATPTVGMRPVDADDTAAFTATLAGGAVLAVSGSWSLVHGTGTRIEAYGSDGTLRLDAQGRLFGARGGDQAPVELPVPARFALPAVVAEHRLVPHVAALSRVLAEAVRGAELPEDAYATFGDGLRLQEIIDVVLNRPTAGRPR